MVDATAESCARALLSGRVARFGVPLTITSDQGLVDVANTADEEDNFDIEKDLPNFFRAVSDRAQCLLQGTLDPEAFEVHFEIRDLTVGLIRSIGESCNLENSDNSLAEVKLLQMC